MGVVPCGKECKGQCITPLPLRVQSLASRRKRKQDDEDDEEEGEEEVRCASETATSTQTSDALRLDEIKKRAQREGTLPPFVLTCAV